MRWEKAYAARDALNVDADRWRQWMMRLDPLMVGWPLKEQAALVAQLSYESGGFRRVEESLNYSTDSLLRTFSRRRITEEQAEKYGRNKAHPADQKALAEVLYGCESAKGRELGNTAPGDGWRYRGRSPVQLTGRGNYRRAGEDLGLPLEDDPDLLARDFDAGAQVCVWFWRGAGLGELLEDKGFEAVTQRLNGGHLGSPQRGRLYAAALAAASKGLSARRAAKARGSRRPDELLFDHYGPLALVEQVAHFRVAA